jgi:hypothetical protein
LRGVRRVGLRSDPREEVSDAIPRTFGVQFDEHRNTSRVWPVPPDARRDAVKALATLDPALRRWIEDGHPNLTDAEHRARFGEPYNAPRPRKARAPT